MTLSARLIALFAILALAATLTLHRLGAPDVCGFNEAVEGVFVQQMVEHGAYLFPLDNARAPLYKPPLFHWTATALDRLTGATDVTAFNLRLPAALYAIAGVALTIAFAAGFLGFSGALIAGLILCGSYQYIENGRVGRVDMTLCFCETLALFSFAWWLAPRAVRRSEAFANEAEHTSGAQRNERASLRAAFRIASLYAGRASGGRPSPRGAAKVATPPLPGAALKSRREESRPRLDALRYLFALALGLAMLAKGPIGAILPVTACVLLLVIEKRFDALRRLLTPGPILLALAVGSSWYTACYFSGHREFLHRQLGSENFGRFFGALGAMAPGYYLKPLLLNSAPLSLLVPVAVFFALRTFWTAPSAEGPRVDGCAVPLTDPDQLPVADRLPDAARARTAVRLFAIFWLVTILFFSVAAYKRRAYLLPLWPASAIMLSWWTLGAVCDSVPSDPSPWSEGERPRMRVAESEPAPSAAEGTRGHSQGSARRARNPIRAPLPDQGEAGASPRATGEGRWFPSPFRRGSASAAEGEASRRVRELRSESEGEVGESASALSAAEGTGAHSSLPLDTQSPPPRYPTIRCIILPSVITIALASSIFNFFYIPRRAIRECGNDSFREAAEQIDRIVGRDEPLYSYKLGDEPAALLFYLDRDAPPLDGRLGDAPPGYVITLAAVWRTEQDTALDLTPVFESTSGAQRLVLLRHGPALAQSPGAPAQVMKRGGRLASHS